MKILIAIITMLVCGYASQAQILGPIDLMIIKEMGPTHTISLMEYTIKHLGNGKLKYVTEIDSTGKDGYYQNYKFSDGQDQNLIIYTLTPKNKAVCPYGAIEYTLYQESDFIAFKGYLERSGLNVKDTGERAGKPYWIWTFPSDAELHLQFSIFMIEKGVGYKIGV